MYRFFNDLNKTCKNFIEVMRVYDNSFNKKSYVMIHVNFHKMFHC